jgi:DNA-binding response OmpR family regulator/putative methionine-R-sulfoxide reductase with GAF domain
MPSAGDRILLVEQDPQISDIIARQALRSLGYQVDVVPDVSSAIASSVQAPPDLIIADLNLPGLNAKDLILALSSQDIHAPVLVVANQGQEHNIIQAFRLGASDALLWPGPDAEGVSAVERVLDRVHGLQDRERLGLKLSEANRELQHKVQELTAIIDLGKAVVSITDQRFLFQKIVDGAIQVGAANSAWLLVRDEESRAYLLSAYRGLPDVWARKMNLPLDDGVSGLVAMSGETFSISGDPLQRFKVASVGRSACVVPIKVQKEVIGMLIVVRQEPRPFEKNEQTLLEAVADYASISLVNARLFRALNNTAQAARDAEKKQKGLLETIRSTFTEDLRPAIYHIDLLLSGKTGKLTDQQRDALQTARAALQRMARAVEKTTPPIPISLKKQ